MFRSRFHLPILLRSTVVTRFLATMRTLTPVPLLPAPGQGSLITEHALQDIPSPTTPCAPDSGHALGTGQAWPTSRLGLASRGSSDFAHYSQSHQSHQAESSLCRSPPGPLFYGLSFHFQLLSTPPRRDAVTFSYWRLAPPERDSHPPVRAPSQAHECATPWRFSGGRDLA